MASPTCPPPLSVFFQVLLYTLLPFLATLLPQTRAEDCADVLASAFCQGQIDLNGFNPDGSAIACAGSGVTCASEECGCTNGPDTLCGLCPTCSNPGLCDATCGYCGVDVTAAPTVTPPADATPSPTAAPTPAPTTPPALSPWVYWAFPLTVVAFVAVSFYYARKHRASALPGQYSRHLLTAFFASVIACGLTLGQACKSFDVSYDVGFQAGSELDYDFYEGVVEMWEKGSPLLSIMLLMFSGVWPFFKQAFTILCLAFDDLEREERWLALLGVTGKLAFLDIAVVSIIITTMNIPLQSDELGVSGYIRSTPAVGTLVVIIVLILSRLLTSGLLHFFPRARDAPKVASAFELPAPHVAVYPAIVVATGLIYTALVAPFITRDYLLTYDYAEAMEQEQVLFSTARETYTLTEVIAEVRGSPGATNKFLGTVMLIFAVILPALSPVLIMGHLLYSRGTKVSPKYASTIRHAMQLCNEWASLDVCCIGACVLSSQIGMMAESMSETMGYSVQAGGAMMEMSIVLEAGCWLGLAGGAIILKLGWYLADLCLQGATGGEEVVKKDAIAPSEAAA